MGLEIDDFTAGIDCALCHAAGETPSIIMASICRVEVGSLWVPGHPPPPNNIWTLNQLAPGNACAYSSSHGPWAFAFAWQNPVAVFGIDYFPFEPFFWQSQGNAPCSNAFGNANNNPVGHFYYGGDCSISWV